MRFKGSLQTKSIESNPFGDLQIRSKTNKIIMKAPDGIEMLSYAATNITSLKDIHLQSATGRVSDFLQRFIYQSLPNSY